MRVSGRAEVPTSRVDNDERGTSLVVRLGSGLKLCDRHKAMPKLNIAGFLAQAKTNPQGTIYRGRFTCPDVQWTLTGNPLCTFTITAGQVADAAASNLLWTDQDVQRGIQPMAAPRPSRELSLAAGYPDPRQYIFDATNADDMVEKLLRGEQVFLNPLIWNLRPGTFEACWDEPAHELFIYDGRVYLPDSHHRHQAIIKAISLWKIAPQDYPKFSDNVQFKVELYFLSRQDEGNYFFDKNQRPKPTAKSKAYDLTTQDDLSILAKSVIEKSQHLRENVNRVTDRLTNRNPQVMTLSTLREMMRTFVTEDAIDSSELGGLAEVAAEFYDMLADVRPELQRQEAVVRQRVRRDLVVDAAVMMHGYAYLMREFNTDIGRIGTTKARDRWHDRLTSLSTFNEYTFGKWAGDIFNKRNPLWAQIGVTRTAGEQSKITVLNTGAARVKSGRVLRQLLAMSARPSDLSFLAEG
jgi:DNA-sulfur modification-associated